MKLDKIIHEQVSYWLVRLLYKLGVSLDRACIIVDITGDIKELIDPMYKSCTDWSDKEANTIGILRARKDINGLK